MVLSNLTIPNLGFDHFVIAEIKDLFDSNKIFINKEYQRSRIWKDKQKAELIGSILNGYSIGVLVLTENVNNFEILDGQQRLCTINDYVRDALQNLKKFGIQEYSLLNKRDKSKIDAYCIFYLIVNSFSPATREEDITQTFLRLQEGSRLNKAEKLNAHRGQFKDTFVKIRETHPLFNEMNGDKRFRFRQLSAELLLLELESNFENFVFPGTDIDTFKIALEKYKRDIPKHTIKSLKGNLDVLYSSLNIMLTAITPRDLVSFYLLVSYLRKKKADNLNLVNELSVFFENFMQKVNSFGFDAVNIPKGFSKKEFEEYLQYKISARQATTPDSFRERLNFMLKKFKEQQPIILKDKKRFHDSEQKRVLYFRQKGVCPICNKKMNFKFSTGHHIEKYSFGGKTEDLSKACLLHEKCHKKVEKNVALAESLKVKK